MMFKILTRRKFINYDNNTIYIGIVIIDNKVVIDTTNVAYSTSVLYKLDNTTVCIIAGNDAIITKTLNINSGIGKINDNKYILSGAIIKRPKQIPINPKSKLIFLSLWNKV